MTEINNLEEWTKTYFEQPENQEKARKACERYDRLMVANVRQQLLGGSEQINLDEIAMADPGKRLEKVKYEIVSPVTMDGKKGKLKINLIDQKAEFTPAR